MAGDPHPSTSYVDSKALALPTLFSGQGLCSGSLREILGLQQGFALAPMRPAMPTTSFEAAAGPFLQVSLGTELKPDFFGRYWQIHI